MASTAMIDGGGGGFCFTPSMSFSVRGRHGDNDDKSAMASESRDHAPQSILEPPLRITLKGGREESGNDGDGAGNPWREFPLWDEDGDGEESMSGRRRAVSQEEITSGRCRSWGEIDEEDGTDPPRALRERLRCARCRRPPRVAVISPEREFPARESTERPIARPREKGMMLEMAVEQRSRTAMEGRRRVLDQSGKGPKRRKSSSLHQRSEGEVVALVDGDAEEEGGTKGNGVVFGVVANSDLEEGL